MSPFLSVEILRLVKPLIILLELSHGLEHTFNRCAVETYDAALHVKELSAKDKVRRLFHELVLWRWLTALATDMLTLHNQSTTIGPCQFQWSF